MQFSLVVFKFYLKVKMTFLVEFWIKLALHLIIKPFIIKPSQLQTILFDGTKLPRYKIR